MITPIELQSKSFKSGIGYDKKDVDNFFNNLLNDYEVLYKENMELNDKINVLNEGINYYKTIEKTLQKALVLAEQTAEDTKESARKQAKVIEDEAIGKARLIVAEAENDLERLRQQTIQLIRQYESYKAQFKHLAQAQVELLSSDSFQIHIANLDTFVHNDVNKDNDLHNHKKHTDEMYNGMDNNNDYEKQTNKQVNTVSQSKTLESNVTKDNDMITFDDDFEFYNVNED